MSKFGCPLDDADVLVKDERLFFSLLFDGQERRVRPSGQQPWAKEAQVTIVVDLALKLYHTLKVTEAWRPIYYLHSYLKEREKRRKEEKTLETMTLGK